MWHANNFYLNNLFGCNDSSACHNIYPLGYADPANVYNPFAIENLDDKTCEKCYRCPILAFLILALIIIGLSIINPNMFIFCTKKEDYLRMLESIYNHQRQKKIRFF